MEQPPEDQGPQREPSIIVKFAF
uniref:Truncated vpr protein n=1 Tax=Human immunodeficiency virus type 1 TaxID=11676 RepID=Q3S5K6_HV1|nr:truncated vpr protein [Human immunodeficiency virus 1]